MKYSNDIGLNYKIRIKRFVQIYNKLKLTLL
jgi:hypothetical protein